MNWKLFYILAVSFNISIITLTGNAGTNCDENSKSCSEIKKEEKEDVAKNKPGSELGIPPYNFFLF